MTNNVKIKEIRKTEYFKYLCTKLNVKIKGIRNTEYLKYLCTKVVRKCVSQLRIKITVFLHVHFSPEQVEVHQLLTHQKKDIYNKLLHQTQHREKHFLHLW